MGNIVQENNTLKAKVRRIEEDNIKKVRFQMIEILNCNHGYPSEFFSKIQVENKRKLNVPY